MSLKPKMLDPRYEWDSASHPKYAVFKWEDWQKVQDQVVAIINSLQSRHPTSRAEIAATMTDWQWNLMVPDGEVIRHQDVTSAPVFFLYSNLINAFIDLQEKPDGSNRVQMNNLREIADYFHGAGIKADENRRNGNTKLPD